MHGIILLHAHACTFYIIAFTEKNAVRHNLSKIQKSKPKARAPEGPRRRKPAGPGVFAGLKAQAAKPRAQNNHGADNKRAVAEVKRGLIIILSEIVCVRESDGWARRNELIVWTTFSCSLTEHAH